MQPGRPENLPTNIVENDRFQQFSISEFLEKLRL